MRRSHRHLPPLLDGSKGLCALPVDYGHVRDERLYSTRITRTSEHSSGQEDDKLEQQGKGGELWNQVKRRGDQREERDKRARKR